MINIHMPFGAVANLNRQSTEVAVFSVGSTYLCTGVANKAAQCFAKLYPSISENDDSQLKLNVICALAETYLMQGKLQLAAATYRSLLDFKGIQPNEPLAFRLHYGMYLINYEWNQLQMANRYLGWCFHTAAQQHMPQDWLIVPHIGLAWLLWADSKGREAESELDRACIAAKRCGDDQCIRLVNAHQARLWLREGNLSKATRWVEQCGLTSNQTIPYHQHFEYLTLARFLITQKRFEETLPLLERLLKQAVLHGRGADAIELHVLRSVTYHQLGDVEHAWIELAQALCPAEFEGYVRTFVDEGMLLATLLQYTAAKGVTIRYCKSLIEAVEKSNIDSITSLIPKVQSSSITKNHPAVENPIETNQIEQIEALTKREQQILHHVSVGHSNAEIAAMLSIAPTTVKKHLSNILGKLGARNRTEAVAFARNRLLLI